MKSNDDSGSERSDHSNSDGSEKPNNNSDQAESPLKNRPSFVNTKEK